jgi:D-alanyl-D-alanine carboxypeptidase (penicillin-binding protein 5/6)
VIDKDSGTVLFEKNADTRLYPASITKMMTAMVALDAYPLDRVLTVHEESKAVGSVMGLRDGEQITVENTVKGLLVGSGNDAAYLLADSYPGGYQKFVDAMNARAADWHLTSTTFLNVSGVEEEGHLTTVRDLATLEKEAMNNEFFRDTVKLPHVTITDTTGTIMHSLDSTNKLLGVVPGIEGVKTGWTDDAGECLVTQTTRDGHTIITVVLNSNDRFGESTKLIEWAYSNHDWKSFSL